MLHVPSVHAPVTQEAFAFGRLHAAPHPPQFERLVFRFVSQPLPPLPSQSPSPGLHDVTPHVLLTQFGVPPAAGHTFPHVLQLFTSEVVFVSQPFAGFPSQSLKPTVHTGVHPAPVQLVLPCAFAHVAPHPRQFVTVFSCVSHPFFAFESQLPKPLVHAGTHAPPTHDVVPLPFVHAEPHPPQLPVDVCTFVSHPFAGLPSQSPNPAVHVGVHTPAGHAVEPFAFVHPAAHAPQFVTVFSVASHPFGTSPSQLPKLGLHAIEQAPSAQLGVPFVVLHAEPHPPQFSTLVCVFTSHPLPVRPSQLPNPPAHVPSVQLPAPQDSLAFA